MTTPSWKTRRFAVRAWTVLALLFTPVAAWGNLGPPSSGGHVVAEPVGIRDVEITSEELTIDLRSLTKNGPVQVEAVYHLDNHGNGKKLDLLFASGSAGMADFQVSLGDQPVKIRSAKDVPLPTSWQAPKRTPGLHGEKELEYLAYGAKATAPVALTLDLPPGRHILKVRYTAEAATHLYGSPTVYRQFAYVLAPARSWSGFGGLAVNIHLPEGWHAACTPALSREGDTLKGNFPALPADAIALTLQAPEGWAYWPLFYGGLGLFALAGLGGLALCRGVGLAKGRRLALPTGPHPNLLQRHAWPLSLGLGLACGLVVLGTGLVATFGSDWALPAGQASHYGYVEALAILGVFFASLLAMLAGSAIAQIAAVRSCRRTQVSSEGTAGLSNTM